MADYYTTTDGIHRLLSSGELMWSLSGTDVSMALALLERYHYAVSNLVIANNSSNIETINTMTERILDVAKDAEKFLNKVYEND